MTRRLALSCSMMLLLLAQVQSQTNTYIFNPGFRMGYNFGSNPGMYFGIDASITASQDGQPFAMGAYVSVEARDGISVTHFGLEFFYRFVGVAVGPAYVTRAGVVDWGWSATAFGGIILLPYYQIVSAAPATTLHGFGMFAKLPVLLQKRHFSIG